MPNYSCINDNYNVKFTLSESSHSGFDFISNCSLPKCNENINDEINCRLSSTPCYQYRSLNDNIYCAPAILCSILDTCSNCSINTSICIINSCCSSKSICLPLLFINFCTISNNIDTTTISFQSIKTTNIKQTTYTSQKIEIKETFENSLITSSFSSTIIPNQCEMQLIDDRICQMINVIPNDISKEEKINFQLISNRGVSFPENNLKPIIIIDFDISTTIQSISIPRDKIPYANIQQFQVTFYFLNENQINQYTILSNLSPKDNKNIPTELNSTEILSNISISWIEIKILHTIDNLSPKGVILDIKGCTKIFLNGWINWDMSRSMNDARYDHTSSLLSNGNVLVTGGSNGNIFLKTCELYDPLSKIWTKISDMNNQRYFHRATRLTNGNILITGGLNQTYNFLNTVELFNLSTNNWTIINNMNYQRGMHAETLLNNGNVLITGGFNGFISLKYAELYDPLTRNWTITGDMIYQRHWHTASLLINGNVLITGGFNNVSALNTAELYDPINGTWKNTNNMKYNRYWHTATVFINGKIFITGGYDGINSLNTTELYDPLTENWINTANMNYPRYQHTATLLNNGKLLVTGGYDGYNQLNTTELYDPLTNNWTIVGNMNYPRCRHTATLLNNERVLVTGGQFNLNSISATELSFN